jgi:ubiquinone/menaquinone biosynthesis C-methylase UbiE
MTGLDYFSKQASDYARYRFGYPQELIKEIASLTNERNLVWDCGTGSGQAAVSLAEYFGHVVATDISERQIANAVCHERVDYRVCAADNSGLKDQSVDLVTAAQAAHWFDLDRFYVECRRVLKPKGAVVLWCYTLPKSREEIDRLVNRYYHEVLAPFWSPCLKLVDNGYKDLPFPFHEISFGTYEAETRWSFSDLQGHLNSWSAAQEFQRVNRKDPFALIREELAAAWGDPNTVVTFRWPLHIKAGRID